MQKYLRVVPKQFKFRTQSLAPLMIAYQAFYKLIGPVLADKFLPEDLKSAYGEDCANYFYHALAQSNAT